MLLTVIYKKGVEGVYFLSVGRIAGDGEACLGVPAAAFAGVMALGVADAAASAIGIRYGRHPICTGVAGSRLYPAQGPRFKAILFDEVTRALKSSGALSG